MQNGKELSCSAYFSLYGENFVSKVILHTTVTADHKVATENFYGFFWFAAIAVLNNNF